MGLDGADPELFVGATWVLTPTAATDPASYARLQAVVVSLGAEVVALSPEQHDALVAVVSHVPHLTAATLMNLADHKAEKHAALLRLAAGGFRDMTRIAAGHPGIWPDVCADNAPAIVDAFDILLADLSAMRDRVAGGDRAGLLEVLDHAAVARRSLPSRAVRPERLTEIRVPVPDRPGVLAEITTLAGDLGVNIADLEIAHSAEGERGVLVLVVDADGSERLQTALTGRAYRSTARSPRMSGTLTVTGGRPLIGTVAVPGDKSISHRALLLAAVAEGTSVVRGLSDGEDVGRTAAAVRALGAAIDGHPDHRGARPHRRAAGTVGHGQLGNHHPPAGRAGGRVGLRRGAWGATPRCRPGPWTGWPSPCGSWGRRWRAAANAVCPPSPSGAGPCGPSTTPPRWPAPR